MTALDEDIEHRLPGITQTLLANRPDGIPGNCLQAAVATFFGMKLEAVPHFVLFTDWVLVLDLWLGGQGVVRVQTDADALTGEACFLLGRSPRDVPHVVLGRGRRLLWDPHPDHSGLASVSAAWVMEAL